jgi:hypothetical protein
MLMLLWTAVLTETKQVQVQAPCWAHDWQLFAELEATRTPLNDAVIAVTSDL